MDRELRDRWVADLRSGKHRQATGYLHPFREGYCCLGRLCEVVGLEKTRYGRAWLYTLDQVSATATLPFTLARRVELDYQTITLLQTMNDTGSTFAEIADYIEQNL